MALPGMGGLPASLTGVSGLVCQSNKLNLARTRANYAIYIGGGGLANTSTSFSLTSGQLATMGAAAGDMFLFTADYPGTGCPINTTGFSGGVFNYPAGNNVSIAIVWRAITAADMLSGITVTGLASSNSHALTYGVYRNVANIIVISQSSVNIVTGSVVDVPGFTPTSKACGFVALFDSRNNSPSRQGPPGWNVRVANVTSPTYSDSTGNFDLLVPAQYIPGTTVSSSSESIINGNMGTVLELQVA